MSPSVVQDILSLAKKPDPSILIWLVVVPEECVSNPFVLLKLNIGAPPPPPIFITGSSEVVPECNTIKLLYDTSSPTLLIVHPPILPVPFILK